MTEIHPSSFRDPQGFVFTRDGTLYRQVNDKGRASYDGLMQSGLYEELVSRHLLVAHVEVPASASEGAGEGAYRLLKPDPVPFVSYPYEWAFGQLKSAALATLRIQAISLRHGMSLRDASAFNIQFVGSRPVFIDTLSFEPYVEGTPWVGYRQFCQHFLAPLFVMAGSDPGLSVLSSRWMDGIPLDLAQRLVRRRYRWKPGFLAHIWLHARAQARFQDAASGLPTPPRLSRSALENLLQSLRATVENLAWNPRKTTWADYYAHTNYTGEDMELKKRIVAGVAKEVKPARVLDLGANTGEFSFIAARAGGYVVAADNDPGAVELCFRRTGAERSETILPLVVDLACPTPAVGWMNQERASFLARCTPAADLVLALALVHHLAIGSNLPLARIIDLLARSGKTCLVEFVEKRDSQVQRLLASREDIFDQYSEAGFEAALHGVFRVTRKERIGAGHRLLYALQRLREPRPAPISAADPYLG